MKIADEYKVPIDYEAQPEPVNMERPTVYQDGTAFCCVSGPDPVEGVFGTGATPAEAIEDWVKAFKKRNAEEA